MLFHSHNIGVQCFPVLCFPSSDGKYFLNNMYATLEHWNIQKDGSRPSFDRNSGALSENKYSSNTLLNAL